MPLSDRYLESVIADAREMTDRIEQKALAILHGRGDMANFDCEGQRDIESRVRELIIEQGDE